MKICITSSGSTVESDLDPRFGRCSHFVIIDLQTEKKVIIENPAVSSGGGAGVVSGQLMVENKVNAVITGNVGPNAMSVLRAAGIEIYRGEKISVKQNLEKFNAGSLEKIIDTVPSHYGMRKEE